MFSLSTWHGIHVNPVTNLVTYLALCDRPCHSHGAAPCKGDGTIAIWPRGRARPLRPRGGLRGGLQRRPHMRSLISIEFPVPEMEPESAHVASAVSVPYLQCGDCNPPPPRQHSPIRRYSGYSATPWYVLIQLPNVIDTISKRWRSKRAFNTSPSHIFP